MVYELAYIAVPSANVKSDNVFKASMEELKKNPKLKEVESETLASHITDLKAVEEAVCVEEMLKMPGIVN